MASDIKSVIYIKLGFQSILNIISKLLLNAIWKLHTIIEIVGYFIYKSIYSWFKPWITKYCRPLDPGALIISTTNHPSRDEQEVAIIWVVSAIMLTPNQGYISYFGPSRMLLYMNSTSQRDNLVEARIILLLKFLLPCRRGIWSRTLFPTHVTHLEQVFRLSGRN